MSLISSQGYNLNNFEANFREFLITEKVSPLTLKNYLSDLRHFLGWFALHLTSNPPQITTERNSNPIDIIMLLDASAVSAYKTYLESNMLPENTINRRLSTVRKFCSFCISQGWLKSNPARNVSNVGIKARQHGHALFRVEVDEERQNSPESNVIFSAKQLYEYKKTLSDRPAAEAQTILKDIEEFFVIINSTKIV